ncbi:helix-turn-helix domain-containing protein [Paenibacillus chitinolyticus]|uniref:helix-turn-helix domain-containing protein n=1 Tax=Paenibacillus chitinolyticus TaxID=79263 RepID=UPI001C45870F|nr:helix-turn-helix transcriptional regulator [Paenibacillus chitinolyticus]MBV6717250.1 helix-turn-helix domain-containing protein [Paenibacillus chitinolyticus]
MTKNTMIRRMLGREIKKVRNRRGLTQERLAELMQSSSSYVARLESGTINITVDTLHRIASILDVTIQELFSFEEYVSELDLNDPLIKIIDLLKKQGPSETEKVYRMLHEFFK